MKNFFRTEWKKIREMNASEKRWYIWEYYKLHIFGFILVSFVVGSFLNAWLNPPRDEYLHIAWLAGVIPFEYLDNISHGLEVIVEDPERQAVIVIDYSATGNPQFDVANQTRFMAMMQIGGIDVFISSWEGVEELANEQLLRPIDGVMEALSASNPALFSRLYPEVRPVTFTRFPEEITVTETRAIPLTDSGFFEEIGINTNDLFLTVVFSSTRYDAIAKTLEVLLYD